MHAGPFPRAEQWIAICRKKDYYKRSPHCGKRRGNKSRYRHAQCTHTETQPRILWWQPNRRLLTKLSIIAQVNLHETFPLLISSVARSSSRQANGSSGRLFSSFQSLSASPGLSIITMKCAVTKTSEALLPLQMEVGSAGRHSVRGAVQHRRHRWRFLTCGYCCCSDDIPPRTKGGELWGGDGGCSLKTPGFGNLHSVISWSFSSR